MRVLRAALAAALIGSAGLVAAQPAAAAADPCGFFARTGTAYYNHCAGDTGTWVEIRIDIPNWPDDYRCVGPGTTKIGSTLSIRNAWYNGRRCPVGGD
ncbi:DUF6355 family natural product biosynthesis protein [Streptomyces sp. NEAU-YJ-81]|uniref:DUF6355 family natural product biosynthesis protein n=1 Tax=Streptomyces sp. NEAU-YJ-81 TaxID=2820288 RepID=UPI001ABD0E9F|nr:DUF6355 family natural product biosynthesis protein [Streptomyces sp. NEAU-YJ-81]MBO3679232.1 hypothetical protein [Streptomyces sp. NEAU-YJ-81]